ncbi:MAG TPA: hypothetical protein VEL03_19895 [Streptosporangiaceae bacterium]|nr:hypothetical protein [Streptosporangiaceae bacterium]
MLEERERARRLRLYGNGVAALVAAILVLAALGVGLETHRPLGPGLVPGHGEWAAWVRR